MNERTLDRMIDMAMRLGRAEADRDRLSSEAYERINEIDRLKGQLGDKDIDLQNTQADWRRDSKRIQELIDEINRIKGEQNASLQALHREGDVRELVLACFGNEKIKAIKAARSLTGLGLREAKDMIDEMWNGRKP